MLTIMITITQSLKQGCCHPSEQIRPKIDNEAARAWDPPPSLGELWESCWEAARVWDPSSVSMSPKFCIGRARLSSNLQNC